MITFEIKKAFFDRAAVAAAVGVARGRVMAKAGAFIRKAARSSMRKRKAAAPPGRPPSAHKGEPNLRTILFAWDARSQSMVIGSVGFPGARTDNPVPALHEFGGVARRVVVERRGRTGRRATAAQAAAFKRKLAAGRVRAPARRTKIVAGTYPARPYMAPALAQEGPKFPDLWKDAVVRKSA